MHLYNLVEHSDIYLKTSGSLQQYYRGESTLNNAGSIVGFPADNNSNVSIEFKEKITDLIGDDGTINV